jgi:hypothetical protein
MRYSSQPEPRRRLELLSECERGGQDRCVVCSRRSLIRDADRELHVVCVPAHTDAKDEPVIRLFLDLPDFDVRHHHSPLRALQTSASLKGAPKDRWEARNFSETGFQIVEIDLARIGPDVPAIAIDSGPDR